MYMESSYKILWNKQYSSEQVFLSEISSTRLIDETLEEKCHSQWEQLVTKAKAEGKHIWDSEVYRFESIDAKENLLDFKVSTIPFSIRRSMNSFVPEIEQLGFDYAARGMYTSCFIVTSDSKYVFIEDGGKYLDRRPIMFVGGVLSKSEKIIKDGTDLFNEAQKECIEETGCNQENIKSVYLNAGYITDSYSVCLLFTINLTCTFHELSQQFVLHNDGEAKNLIAVNESEIAPFGKSLHTKEHIKFILKGLL